VPILRPPFPHQLQQARPREEVPRPTHERGRRHDWTADAGGGRRAGHGNRRCGRLQIKKENEKNERQESKLKSSGLTPTKFTDLISYTHDCRRRPGNNIFGNNRPLQKYVKAEQKYVTEELFDLSK
jgi:hypothetical protein